MSVRLSLEGKVERVQLSLLKVDDTYQRGVKPHSRKIERNWMPQAAGILQVGRRGNSDLYIIDGLQRVTAMKKLGIEYWKALVLESSSPQFEAQIFKLLNGGRVAITAAQMFATSLTAKDPIALAAVEAVKAAGAKVMLPSRSSTGTKKLTYGEVSCLGGLYRHTARWGEGVVTRAISLIMKTWPGQDEAMGELFVYGVVSLVAWQGEILDDGRFVSQLGVPPRQILLDVGNYTNGRPKAMVEVLCKYYNKGLKPSSKSRVKTLEQLRLFQEEQEVKEVS